MISDVKYFIVYDLISEKRQARETRSIFLFSDGFHAARMFSIGALPAPRDPAGAVIRDTINHGREPPEPRKRGNHGTFRNDQSTARNSVRRGSAQGAWLRRPPSGPAR